MQIWIHFIVSDTIFFFQIFYKTVHSFYQQKKEKKTFLIKKKV